MTGALFLKGDSINLRTVEEEDVEFLRDGINNPDVWKNLSVSRPLNMEQQRDFFENVISDDEQVNLAISNKEEIVGIISLIPEEDKGVAKIGLWLAEQFHGNGYGTEASELMVGYALQELQYHKVIARAHESNTGSQRIWEKLGFEKEGKLRDQHYRNGEFEDIYYYGILEDEWGE